MIDTSAGGTGTQQPSAEDLTALHLHAIVEWSDDAIVSKNLDGIVQSWNPGAERIFGYTAEEMIGQSIRRIIPDDLQSEEDEVLRRLRAGERIDHFETVRQRKDGSRVSISLTVSPIKNARGEVIGASKIARDVTERVAADEALRASVALKDQFLNLVSHELRTPVSTVVGNAQLLLRRSDRLSERSRGEALADIASEAGRLQNIVEDLLVLTRLGSPEQLPLVPIDLAEIATDALRSVRRAKQDRKYVLDVSPDLPVAAGDAALTRLVLLNLLNNAEKYSPPDTTVEISLRRNQSGEAEVQVKDRGLGVEAADAERIFESFYRAPNAQAEAPGLGLGLAVCWKALDAQGGWIRVEPRPGGGSIFIFALHASDVS